MPGQSQVSGAAQLVTLSADLRVAQDYENYLNNREAINAVMAAYPESAFTAGWIATFARVNDLKLNQVSGSDFLGGLVGYLDSVNKAGLGAVAANATIKQSGGDVTVEIKVSNGADIPGSLSVFADHTSQSSDASGTTVQFGFINGLAAGFHGPGSTSLVSGVWQASGGAGNNLWFGRDDVRNEYHDYNGAQSHDILVGGAFSDTIYAGNGFDFVDGGAGGDYLFGQDGNDVLRGGKDTDLIYGGAGDDTYVFNRGDGADTVFDDVTVTTTTSYWHDRYEDQDGTNILQLALSRASVTDHAAAVARHSCR
jgi:Ca2+-binding RTX toxin-like protein